MFQFTKNKQTGDYDVIGPAKEMVEGRIIDVTLKSGQTRKVRIRTTSSEFTAKFGPHEGKPVKIGVVGSIKAAAEEEDAYAQPEDIQDSDEPPF